MDLPRLVLPVAMQVNGANAAVPPPKYPAAAAVPGSAGGAADNPFGGPAASQPSTGGGAADNPFGTTASVGGASGAASARHSHKPSADNPFAGGAGAAAAADNPFGGSSASGRPSGGSSVSAADGAMFAARSGAASRKGPGGGPGEPPVTSLASGVRLNYSMAGADTSGRNGGGGGAAAAAAAAAGGEEAPFGGVRPPRLDLPELETGASRVNGECVYLCVHVCVYVYVCVCVCVPGDGACGPRSPESPEL